MPESSVTSKEIDETYNNLKEELEANHLGKYVQMKLGSREYVVGDSRTEANRAYSEQFGDAPSCIAKVGDITRVRRSRLA